MFDFVGYQIDLSITLVCVPFIMATSPISRIEELIFPLLANISLSSLMRVIGEDDIIKDTQTKVINKSI